MLPLTFARRKNGGPPESCTQTVAVKSRACLTINTSGPNGAAPRYRTGLSPASTGRLSWFSLGGRWGAWRDLNPLRPPSQGGSSTASESGTVNWSPHLELHQESSTYRVAAFH